MTDVSAAPAPAPTSSSAPGADATDLNANESGANAITADQANGQDNLISDPENTFESPDQKPAPQEKNEPDKSVKDRMPERAPKNAKEKMEKQLQNDKESEIERFIISMRPEERAALAFQGQDLAKKTDPTAVKDSASTLQESVLVNRHMNDIQDMIQNRHENPHFRVEIGEKMIQTNEAIQHLETRVQELQAKGQKPANSAPVENSVEMLLRILEQIFGKKSGLSKEEEEHLHEITEDLERMRERMQGIEVGMKTYRQEYGNKNENEANNDSKPTKFSQSGPSLGG